MQVVAVERVRQRLRTELLQQFVGGVGGLPQQAAEAVLLAQVPEIARVNKKEIKTTDVNYNGEPEYETIQGTQLQRAKNTDKEIIKVGDLYYMCFQGVWFTANTPKGPWTIASSVPADIYNIPPSSPSHSVTYVTVEEDDDASDEIVKWTILPQPEEITLSIADPQQLRTRDRHVLWFPVEQNQFGRIRGDVHARHRLNWRARQVRANILPVFIIR